MLINSITSLDTDHSYHNTTRIIILGLIFCSPPTISTEYMMKKAPVVQNSTLEQSTVPIRQILEIPVESNVGRWQSYY